MKRLKIVSMLLVAVLVFGMTSFVENVRADEEEISVEETESSEAEESAEVEEFAEVEVAETEESVEAEESAEVEEPAETEDLDSEEVLPSTTILHSGSCGDNATFELDDQGVCTISGSGSIASSSFTGKSYSLSIKKVVIKEGIHYRKTKSFQKHF